MYKLALQLFQRAPYPIKVLMASVNGIKLNYWRNLKRDKYLAEISKRDNWSREEMEQWQKVQLTKMLDHAVKTVPYYRKWWKKQWEKTPDLSHLELENWPILEKDIIKKDPAAFISDKYNPKKLYQISTSGTSGTPMTFWFTRKALSLWYALYEHRTRRWNGVSDQDRWANIGGQLICDVNQTKPPFWVWNMPMKQLYFSSYHVSPENIKHYIKALRKHKIKYFLGYVSSIYNLANESLRQGIKLPKLELVITCAEPLLENQRAVISEAFSCKVVETYSGCEFAFGGNEDLTGTMYLWPEAGIMEVVDKNDRFLPKGKVGNFVATGLVNKAMPLVRYRIGDSGALATDDEDRNRNFSVLREVTGRNDDLIYTAEGKLVGRLDPVFKGDFNIKEAQIIQEKIDFIRVLIVPFPAYKAAEGEEIVNRLKERVGSKTKVTFELIDSIPRTSNGKFKAVVSKINASDIDGK